MSLQFFKFHARSIIESHECETTINEYSEKHNRVNEVFEAIKWLLARMPDRGEKFAYVPSTDTEYHLIKSPEWTKLAPQVVAVYSYTDDDVQIIAIKIDETE